MEEKCDIVNLEIAKILKEIEFNDYCKFKWEIGRYGEPELRSSKCSIINFLLKKQRTHIYSAPSRQQALDWLRETQNIIISAEVESIENNGSNFGGEIVTYNYEIIMYKPETFHNLLYTKRIVQVFEEKIFEKYNSVIDIAILETLKIIKNGRKKGDVLL